MSKLTALSISIAVLGAIWAYLALGPLAGFVLVWAGFIAWACFFHTGADMPALQKTIVGMSYGAVIAGIALLLATTNPLGLPGVLGTAIYVGVTVFFLVIVARFDLLSVDMTNPVLIIILSTILGAVFGLLSAKLAAAIEKKS